MCWNKLKGACTSLNESKSAIISSVELEQA